MDKIITHVLPLSSFQQGLQLVMNSATSIKVLLDPALPCDEAPIAASPLPQGAHHSLLTESECDTCCEHPSSFQLEHAVVWVTGSSRGIGRAVAESTNLGRHCFSIFTANMS
jgi:hypothetical protein